jgi:hypothetical protein
MPSTDHAIIDKTRKQLFNGTSVAAPDSAAANLAGTTARHSVPAALSAASVYTLDASGMAEGDETTVFRMAASANTADVDYGGAANVVLPATGDSSVTFKLIGGVLVPVASFGV